MFTVDAEVSYRIYQVNACSHSSVLTEFETKNANSHMAFAGIVHGGSIIHPYLFGSGLKIGTKEYLDILLL